MTWPMLHSAAVCSLWIIINGVLHGVCLTQHWVILVSKVRYVGWIIGGRFGKLPVVWLQADVGMSWQVMLGVAGAGQTGDPSSVLLVGLKGGIRLVRVGCVFTRQYIAGCSPPSRGKGGNSGLEWLLVGW